MKLDTPVFSENSLSADELRETREIWNRDRTPILAFLSSGRVVLFTRRGDFIAAANSDFPITKESLDSILDMYVELRVRIQPRHKIESLEL